MKLDIDLISLCIFWWFPVYLDLDTGKTYNTRLNTAEIEKLKHKIRIPHYSEAPVQQRYLEMARERLGFQPGDWFDQYPKFELIPEYEPEGIEEFYDKAHIAINSILLDSFPSYGEYLEEVSLRLAKDWCEKEGFEWYDSRKKTDSESSSPTIH